MVTALTLATKERNQLGTFPEVLAVWAREAPLRRAYTYLSDGEREEASLTFAELRSAALTVARHLGEIVKPGDRVLLFYPSGLDFIVAFLGCLCAGAVAVPVSVPNRKRGLEIVAGIAADSGATCLLSVGALLARFEEDFAADAVLGKLRRLDTACWAASGETAELSVPIDPAAPALLQYTSGSTGVPRGVIVTHANLADNQRQQQRCMRNDESAVIVSWLPMFHDMGLGTMLQALWVGAQCVLMSPAAFLQKPVRWLQAISRYGGTRSGGPDFAFDVCVRNIPPEECQGLNLSTWTYAYNGSEPVRAATLARFHEAFGLYGFKQEAFHALYGLAEATLFVTGDALHEAPTVASFSRHDLERGVARIESGKNGQALVSCGHPWLDSRISIVDPDTRSPCENGRIGEIWVSGPSVALGYWGKEEDTTEVFRAQTGSGEGPFLRTGDLGFLHDGRLFVTGRSKDLIIVRGRNHYPQDIEDTVSTSHPALEPQRCAAFSVDTDDGEGVVVAQEIKRSALRNVDPEDVFRAIRNSIADRHGLSAAAIVLLRPLALPRTTSGKVRRKSCREGFLSGTLSEVASSGFVGASVQPPVRTTVPPPESMSAARVVQWLKQYSRTSALAEVSRRSVAPEALAAFARQGLLGMQVGTEHGGLALRHGDTMRVLEQLGGVDLGASLFVGLNNYLGVGPILRHGHQQLQQELLPQLASGQALVGFALAEPGGEANSDAWSSRAEKVNGSGWSLSGTKFVTGGTPDAGFLNVFVRHTDRPGISGFAVPRNASGVRRKAGTNEDGILRDSLQLQDVFVRHHQVLGQIGQAGEVAFEAIRHSHLAIGAACLGGIKRCSQLIFQHATQRQIGEAGLVAHPVTMTRLGRITAEVTALECLVRLLAEQVDDGRSVLAEAFTVCKLVGPEMLWQAVDDLVQLLGRRGLVETLQVRQLVDDARVLRGLEGPMEAGAAILGAGLTSRGLEPLRSVAGELFAGVDLEAPVSLATHVLEEATRATAGGPPSSEHWLDARAGELATWLILLGAVEHKRRTGTTADLERTALWVRSNLDGALALTRSGPPPEIRIGAGVVGDAIAGYERSVSGLGSALSHERRTWIQGSNPSGLNLRDWAISWLAQRLRVEEGQIDPRRSFADHGVDSLAAVEFAKALADRVGVQLDDTLLWNFPTIDSLLSYLERPRPSPAASGVAPTEGGARPAGSSAQATAGSPSSSGSALEDELARLEQELKRRS